VSVDRSVWSKAFFFQQLPAPTCTLNLSAPQHRAPSSTQRPFADQPRSNSAFRSRAQGTGWEQGAHRVPRTMPAAKHQRDAVPCRSGAGQAAGAGLRGPGDSFLHAPCQRLTRSSAVQREVSNFLVTQCFIAKTGNDIRLVKKCNYYFQDHFSLDSRFVMIITLHTPGSNRTVPVGISPFLPKCILRCRVGSTAKIHFTFHKQAEPQMEVLFSLTTEKISGIYRYREPRPCCNSLSHPPLQPSLPKHPVLSPPQEFRQR